MAFHNPYNFVPAPPRSGLPDGLRDDPPPGHHRWHADRWSGDITVTMTVVTPLLLVREPTSSKEADGHRHLAVVTGRDHDGVERVDLAPTQVKGMLRSIYEAATNSRFGVFDQEKPYGYRATTEGAAELLPAIITADREIVLPGDLVLDNGLRSRAAVGVSAWTEGDDRRWRQGSCAHGQELDAVVEWDTMLRRFEAVTLHRPGTAPKPDPGEQFVVRGLLHATGPSIQAKKAERLFVTDVIDDQNGRLRQLGSTPVDPAKARALIDKLAGLVQHQREIHCNAGTDGIWQRDHLSPSSRPWEYYGHEPGRTAWSRHLYDADGTDAPDWVGADVRIPPRDGTQVTCWAEPGSKRLRPVMISRLRYEHPPSKLLHESLHPARSVEELSPADRLFGWSWQRPTLEAERPAPSAHRGQLRVVEVQAPETDSAVEVLDPPLTIPPLATPKPSQGRFYLGQQGRDGTVAALPANVRRGQFFTRGQQALRGRKVYPHHRELEGLDTAALRRKFEHRPVEGRAMVDSQNATLHSWAMPGARFRFVLRLTDVHPVELGALLWLLDPARCGTSAAPARHRLGMGKPLGFGAVELAVDKGSTRLYPGRHMIDRLSGLDAEVVTADWTPLVDRFEQAMASVLDVLAAVRAALSGYPGGARVGYPRNAPPRKASYSWFVKNEADKRPQALPLLADLSPLTEYREEEQ